MDHYLENKIINTGSKRRKYTINMDEMKKGVKELHQ